MRLEMSIAEMLLFLFSKIKLLGTVNSLQRRTPLGLALAVLLREMSVL